MKIFTSRTSKTRLNSIRNKYVRKMCDVEDIFVGAELGKKGMEDTYSENG